MFSVTLIKKNVNIFNAYLTKNDINKSIKTVKPN